MKKLFSLLVIMTLLSIMTMSLFCQPSEGYFTTKKVVVQKYIAPKAEVLEISTWSAEIISKEYSNIAFNSNSGNWSKWNFSGTVINDDLTYTLSAKYDNLELKTLPGTLDKTEGTFPIELKCYGNDKMTFTIKVKKTITQAHEDAIQEQEGKTDIIVTGYVYTKGEYKDFRVIFRPKIIKQIITKTSEGTTISKYTEDYKKLVKMMPFKPNTSRLWEKCKWLYLRCDWTIPTPNPTQSESVSPSISPSESILPSESSEPSIDPTTEPTILPSADPTSNVVYGNSLPKTGESENILLVIAGVLVISVGGYLVYKVVITKNI